MSIKVIDYYLEHCRRPANEKLCLVILADWADDEGFCFPGQNRVARKMNMSLTGVRKLLYKLRDEGEIDIHQGKGVHTVTGSTNRYELVSFRERFHSAEIESKGDPTGIPLNEQGYPNENQGYPNEPSRVSTAMDTNPSVLDPSDKNHQQQEAAAAGSLRSEDDPVMSMYMNNFGLPGMTVTESIYEAQDKYGDEWVIDAIKEASKAGAKSFNYIEAILARWADEGRNSKKPTGTESTMSIQDLIRETNERVSYMEKTAK